LAEYELYVHGIVAKLQQANPASPLSTLLADAEPGAEWIEDAAWGVGRHYVLLVSRSDEGVSGWAWLDEEREWWTLQDIWVDPRSRGTGLGSYLVRYIESATQYPSRERHVPSELRLTALGPAEGFYEKLGYPRLGGCVFAKELLGTLAEFSEFHRSSRLFQPGEARSFRLHIVPVP